MGIIDESNADVFGMAFTDSDAMPGVEAATYNRFGNTNGVSVNLQVNRHPVEDATEAGYGRLYRVTVFLASNTNITSINTGGDTVTGISPTYGGSSATMSVAEVLEQSPAGWLLLLR